MINEDGRIVVDSGEPESSLLTKIPEYKHILDELSKGNLKANFSLNERKSKLNRSLRELVFSTGGVSGGDGERNDEFAYFLLFMDSVGAANYVKFLLDVMNFERLLLASANSSTIDQHALNIAIDIFSKYISKEAVYSIGLDDQLISATIIKLCPEDDNAIGSDCFDTCKDHVLALLQNDYFPRYLISECHCKYILGVLERQELTLADVLYDDIAIVYLLEHLEKEGVSDLLKFWMQAESFSRNLLLLLVDEEANANAAKAHALRTNWKSFCAQVQNDAMVIYDKFISMQAAVRSLGFDSLIRRQVEFNVCSIVEDDDPDHAVSANSTAYLLDSYANCFYVPMLVVFNVLDKVLFAKFLQSRTFRAYKQDVLANVRYHHHPNPNPSMKFDTSTNNKPQLTTHSSSSMKENVPVQRSDREKKPNMQLGRINSTGRFVRTFDSADDIAACKLTTTKHVANVTTAVAADADDATAIYADDIWSVNGNEVPHADAIEVARAARPGKSRFGKLIDLLPPLHRSAASASREDHEMAEQVAAMLVNDVIKQNANHLI